MYDGQGVKCLLYKIIKILRKKKETPPESWSCTVGCLSRIGKNKPDRQVVYTPPLNTHCYIFNTIILYGLFRLIRHSRECLYRNIAVSAYTAA